MHFNFCLIGTISGHALQKSCSSEPEKKLCLETSSLARTEFYLLICSCETFFRISSHRPRVQSDRVGLG